MRDFRRPDFMKEAVRGRKSNFAFVEVLIALAVFIISSVVIAIVVTPFMVPYFINSEGFKEFMATGNQEAYMEQIQNIAHNIPPSIMIVMLIAELLMIAIVIGYCRLIEKRKIFTMGFVKKNALKSYGIGAVAGLLAMVIVWGVNCLTGAMSAESGVSSTSFFTIFGFFVGYLIQGMAEEVLCRGYLFVSLSRRYSVTYSAIVSALFFSLLHGANSGVSLLAFINIFLFGIFAALLVIKFENIWVAGAFHSIWNFAQGNLFGIQVSGNKTQPSLINSKQNEGMGILNGGAFGVEGGIIVTVVLMACIVIVYKMIQREDKIVEYDLSRIGKYAPESQISGEQNRSQTPEPDGVSGGEMQPAYEKQGVVNFDTLKGNRNLEIPDETSFDSSYFKD